MATDNTWEPIEEVGVQYYGLDSVVDNEDVLQLISGDPTDQAQLSILVNGVNIVDDDVYHAQQPTIALGPGGMHVAVWSGRADPYYYGNARLYMAAHNPSGPVTKHYYANGQRIATRVDGVLYYTLSDPTGTSLTLTDADGDEAGYLLYDAYGGVLTGTLSEDLTGALAGQGATADPDTGLVYQGNGRYYDPALGRPLQPSPLGGVPSVPQSLNRYAATSLGPVGVAEAQIGYQPGVVEKGLFKTALTYLVNQGQQVLIAQLTAQRATGWVNLTVRGVRGSVPESLGLTVTGETVEELTLFESYLALRTSAPPLARLFVAGRVARDLGRRLLGRQTVWQTLEGRVLQSELESMGPDVEVLAATAEERAILSATSAVWLRHGIGASWAVGLNVLVQYWGDVGDPYLTSEQRTWRVVSAGVGGGVGGYLFVLGAQSLLTAQVGTVLGIEAGPAGILVGGAAGFIYGLVYYGLVQPHIIFPAFGLSPERNLAPLQP